MEKSEKYVKKESMRIVFCMLCSGSQRIIHFKEIWQGSNLKAVYMLSFIIIVIIIIVVVVEDSEVI